MDAGVYDADAGGVVQTRRAETHADIAVILSAKGIQICALTVVASAARVAVVLQVLVVAVLAAEGGGGAVSAVSVVI